VTTQHPRLSRRSLLGAGGAALLLSGCDAPWSRTGPQSSPGDPLEPATRQQLLSRTPFYIAHRGSYDNWPEHTMEAYRKSVEGGALALEVSVNATSDGVLVCNHDRTTKRLGTAAVTIADVTAAELARISVDERPWLGPSAALQPIPALRDVLDAYATSRVIFIEDKQGTNTVRLLDLMDSYASSRDHFVWKQWAASNQYREAAGRGYSRWGYFTPEILDRLDELAPRFDILGVPVSATDRQVKAFVATGKPVIAWEVHTRHERDRLQALGVVGMMCSNLPYVQPSAVTRSADEFATGLRAPGDLPWTTGRGPSYQPEFDVLNSAVTVLKPGPQSYCMGSMAPITADSYSLQWQLRWPGALPQDVQHAGIAFGQPDDRPYRVRVPSAVPGYHVIVRAKGVVELFYRPAGTVDGISLGAVPTRTIEAGQWISMRVDVTPETITVRREGLDTWTFTVEDSRYRGGYFSLTKNYASGPPVQFRAVTVS